MSVTSYNLTDAELWRTLPLLVEWRTPFCVFPGAVVSRIKVSPAYARDLRRAIYHKERDAEHTDP